MHVLIIGGLGFMGRAFSKYLSEDRRYTVTSIDIREHVEDNGVEHIKSDLSSQQEVDHIFAQIQKKYGSEVAVFHFAGTSHKELCQNAPLKAIFTNITLSAYLMLACKKFGFKKFIFPSSGLVYTPKDGVALIEEDGLTIDSLYAAVKAAAENTLQGLSLSNDIDCYVLRVSNVYGAESNKLTFFGTVLDQAKDGCKSISLFRLKPKCDFIYIKDILNCYQLIIDSANKDQRFNIYNLSTGLSYSTGEVAKKVCEKLGFLDVQLCSTSSNDTETDMILSNQKIRSELGWSPKFSIDQGIEDCLKERLVLDR